MSIGVFLIFFLVFHNSQKKVYRNIFISIAIILVAFQSFFFIKYYNGNIIYNTKGLIVYKGIPIPYFDIMIYPNGTFRLVDKKLILSILINTIPSILFQKISFLSEAVAMEKEARASLKTRKHSSYSTQKQNFLFKS